MFRYVRSEMPWKEIELCCTGRGVVSVFLNGEKAGEIHVSGEKRSIRIMRAPIAMDNGEYELMLRFEKSEEMELMAVTLF